MNHSSQSKLSVIIVSWNTCQDLKNCLQSHFAAAKNLQAPVETIVIDNHSSDDSVAMVKDFAKKGHTVRLIENSTNVGFSRACNQGLQAAQGEHLLLLNPDTLLLPETYVESLKFISQNREIGIFGIRTLNPDSTLQPSAWPEPTLCGLAVEALYLHLLFPKQARGKHFLSGYFAYDSSLEVGMVLGSYFWITRECFQRISGLDENIFMFGEELEYSMRARRAGFKTFFFSGATYIHLGNQASKQLPPDWRVQRTVSTLYYVLSLYHSAVWLRIFALLEILSFSVRLATEPLRQMRPKQSSATGYVPSAAGKYLRAHEAMAKILWRKSYRQVLCKTVGEP